MNRLSSTTARTYAQRFIPPYIRESLLLYVTNMSDWNRPGNDPSLGGGSGAAYDRIMNRIAKFWAILYSPALKTIHLPQELHEKTFKNILQVYSNKKDAKSVWF